MVMQWQDGIPDDAHKRTWGLDLSGTRHGAGGVGDLLGSHDWENGEPCGSPVRPPSFCLHHPVSSA